MSTKQHGFVASQSMPTNLLQSEASVSGFQFFWHPYDVITFDFQKTFDEAPYSWAIHAI